MMVIHDPPEFENNGVVLMALRRQFDQQLADLTKPGASERIRQATSEPLELKGQFKVGESH